MSLPLPRPGLVICYSYLWARERRDGTLEGRKDRPCAIVVAQQAVATHRVVTVVPITHSPPVKPENAVEIPTTLKTYLDLDDARSWIVVTETNDFLWPGPDLRPRPGFQPLRFDYGILPPRFYAHVRQKILDAYRQRALTQIPRPE